VELVAFAVTMKNVPPFVRPVMELPDIVTACPTSRNVFTGKPVAVTVKPSPSAVIVIPVTEFVLMTLAVANASDASPGIEPGFTDFRSTKPE
jgi:hypothetical protein